MKRLFDLVLSAIGCIILWPIFFYIAIKIKQEDKGPIFYRGIRIGLKGKPFRIYKFRTMCINAEEIGPSSTADGDSRITCIGRWIRKYKIDELPQLLNVLSGQMSMVGPRPQVLWAVKLYTSEEKKILNVKPGITDYASLLFSNEADILKGSKDPDKVYLKKIHPEKTRLALYYVNNNSIKIDLKIILMTLKKIIWGK